MSIPVFDATSPVRDSLNMACSRCEKQAGSNTIHASGELCQSYPLGEG